MGLATGPCPTKRNDSTVCIGEGDLMLCRDCDFERHRQWLEIRNAASVPQTRSVRSNSTSSTSTITTTTTATPTTTAGAAGATGTTAAAVTAETTDTHQTSSRSRKKVPTKSTVTEKPHTEECSVCLQKCSRFLSCDICCGKYDQNCSTLPSTIFDTVLSIVQHTGWVCINCRNRFQSVVKQLQIAQTKTVEDLATISDAVSELQHEMQTVREAITVKAQVPPTELIVHQNKSVIDDNKQKVSVVALEVHRTISDMARRRCNVIVTGIPETDSNNNDESAFLKLCEENLSVKPSLSRHGCRRLGQQDRSGRPRKLLVHLTSEENVKDVLREAPKLRCSSDTANIYINPDLSPAEAAMAYHRRQRRRQARVDRGTDDTLPATQQVVQSVDENKTTDYSGDITSQTIIPQSDYSPTPPTIAPFQAT